MYAHAILGQGNSGEKDDCRLVFGAGGSYSGRKPIRRIGRRTLGLATYCGLTTAADDEQGTVGFSRDLACESTEQLFFLADPLDTQNHQADIL